jgi:hypothetical protein
MGKYDLNGEYLGAGMILFQAETDPEKVKAARARHCKWMEYIKRMEAAGEQFGLMSDEFKKIRDEMRAWAKEKKS